MNFKKYIILKKAWRYYNELHRTTKRFNHLHRAAVIANSFPKSGTHLLIQILQAIPNIRDLGNFIVSRPSLTYKERNHIKIVDSINNTFENELVSAHITYHDDYLKFLKEKKSVVYFIYRDPRDVVISEAEYLFSMNKFHYLHKYFKRIPDLNNRIKFSMLGDEYINTGRNYKNIKERYLEYYQWIQSEYCYSIKYEDLIGINKEKEIYNMFEYYLSCNNSDFDIDVMVKKALSLIEPRKSHTFRRGGSCNWKSLFSDENKKLFKNTTDNLLVDLDYETNNNW